MSTDNKSQADRCASRGPSPRPQPLSSYSAILDRWTTVPRIRSDGVFFGRAPNHRALSHRERLMPDLLLSTLNGDLLLPPPSKPRRAFRGRVHAATRHSWVMYLLPRHQLLVTNNPALHQQLGQIESKIESWLRCSRYGHGDAANCGSASGVAPCKRSIVSVYVLRQGLQERQRTGKRTHFLSSVRQRPRVSSL
ncbi:hypothetical protein IG631_24070 [Alternaria alternata]|nr:hypothetical protein IG631_24070 [Alternaria alternata]